MNGLVGYCSSSDSEGEDEEPQKLSSSLTHEQPILPTNNPQITHEQPILPTNNPQITHEQPVAPTPKPDLDKKLDISDDEESYIPKPKTPASSFAPTPAPSLAPTPNISEVIDSAQIVSVDRTNLQTESGVISTFLPPPKHSTVREVELEHLHNSKRRKRDKKRIFALNLDDYLEDVKPEIPKPRHSEAPKPAPGSHGLFSVLPQPKNSKIGTKSTKSVIPGKSKMLKPRTIQPRPVPRKNLAEGEGDPGEDEGSDFFSFSTSNRRSEEIAEAAKAVKLDQFAPKIAAGAPAPATMKVQGELRSIDAITTPFICDEVVPEVPVLDTDNIAKIPSDFRDLAFNNTQIIDVNQEIQSTEEWALKNLDYSDEKKSSGKCTLGGKARSKNQISYLAWQARDRETELKNQWAQNRANRHATQSKYGFR